MDRVDSRSQTISALARDLARERRAPGSRAYDLLLESARGMPEIEAIIAKWANAMALSPEDPLWEESIPVLLAAMTVRIDEDTAQKIIKAALAAELNALGRNTFLAQLCAQANGPWVNALRAQIQAEVSEHFAESRKETAKEMHEISSHVKATVTQYSKAINWRQSIVAASMAALITSSVILGDHVYADRSGYSRGYTEGWNIAVYQLKRQNKAK